VEDWPFRRWGVAMDFLYSAGRKHVDPRYCRTHSGVARLFAGSVKSDFNAEAWIYVAQAWSELADLKELIAREKSRERLVPDDLHGHDQPVHSPADQPHQM
jgi:hypothetical protein